MNVITGETYGQARKVTPLQQMQQPQQVFPPDLYMYDPIGH